MPQVASVVLVLLEVLLAVVLAVPLVAVLLVAAPMVLLVVPLAVASGDSGVPAVSVVLALVLAALESVEAAATGQLTMKLLI